MSPVIEQLLVLQARDQAASLARAELDRLPAELAALDAEEERQRLQFDAFKEQVRQVETERKQLDLEVQSKQTTVGRYRQQQLETRKNEEFSALGHEIERAQNEISALEDRELALMMRYDEGQKEVVTRKQAFEAAQARVAQSREALAQKKAALEKRLAETQEQRTQAEGQLEEESLSRYRRILQSKKDVALVPIVHGNCGGCHMKLTSQTVLSAKGAERLVTCENCGRLLYWTD